MIKAIHLAQRLNEPTQPRLTHKDSNDFDSRQQSTVVTHGQVQLKQVC